MHKEGPTSVMLTSDELAAILKVSVGTIRMMAIKGEIPYMKLGRYYRFNLCEVTKQLADNAEPKE